MMDDNALKATVNLAHEILATSDNLIERYLAMTGLWAAGLETPGWIFELNVTDLVLNNAREYSTQSLDLARLLVSTGTIESLMNKSRLLI